MWRLWTMWTDSPTYTFYFQNSGETQTINGAKTLWGPVNRDSHFDGSLRNVERREPGLSVLLSQRQATTGGGRKAKQKPWEK